MSKGDVSREAPLGKRMIQIKIAFWTNDIADEKGKIVPKNAWGGGFVRLEGNRIHGIVPQNPVPFQSLLELPATIEKVLIQHGIRIHPTRRMKKYHAVR